MGVPTSEVGYTPAMPRREDHEVHKGHVVAMDKKKIIVHFFKSFCNVPCEMHLSENGQNCGRNM